MTKAEEKSQNRYPTLAEKYAFIDGYEQAEKDILFNNEKYHTVQVSILDELYDIKKKYEAEKDLELTWEDMMLIHRCIKDAMNYNLYKMMEGVEGQKEVYQNVLKRFLENKKIIV